MMSEHTTWSKEARYLALLGLLCGVVVILWYFHGIFSPLVVAAIFAYILHPAVEFLEKRTRLSHSLSVLIIYLASILILGAVIGSITPVLVNQIRAIELDLEGLVSYYEELSTTPLIVFNRTIYPGQVLPPLPEISTDLLTPLMNNLFAIFEFVTKNSIWVLMVLVSLYYFLQDGHKVQVWIVRIAPEEYRQDVDRLYQQLQHVWADYLRSQLVFMFVVGLVDSIVWLAIGLPGAIILGMLTGITSFVHEIGAIVSGVLSVLAALIGGSSFLQMSNFWFAVLVFILYMVLTGIKNIWIRPVIVGRHVHLHAGIVFVVVIAALIFHGALAAFLVVPVLVSLLVIGRYLRRRILNLPPFPEGQDPSSYFSIDLPTEPIEVGYGDKAD
jgi:predicted PurR-regulated permease PerM